MSRTSKSFTVTESINEGLEEGCSGPHGNNKLKRSMARGILQKSGGDVPGMRCCHELVSDCAGLCLTYANEFSMNKEDTKWPKEVDVWWHDAVPKHSTKCVVEWVDAEERLFLLYSIHNRKHRKSKVWGKVVSFCIFLMVLSLLALSMVLNYHWLNQRFRTITTGWKTYVGALSIGYRTC
ncbi:AMP-dependent synthetase/ligase, Acetyl-coenzyme A synthetase domain protein [Artemisia annua]|uniref:AMP-dependent synthetase/ligase, Acetyl-coenzyme A synthetase domain protein n=1 Tax=Artemisia annua TaxID=35608 RepID=A0A2U1PBJ3_ARTAN|nr:AMP-dependent synthetase/ligase, Acetyl-coenzyme A synthetase domain protein [Artemisia annua]